MTEYSWTYTVKMPDGRKAKPVAVSRARAAWRYLWGRLLGSRSDRPCPGPVRPTQPIPPPLYFGKTEFPEWRHKRGWKTDGIADIIQPADEIRGDE